MQTVPLRIAPMDVFPKQMLVPLNAPIKSALRAFAAMKLAPLLQATSAVRDLVLQTWPLIVAQTRMS
jgi:hypothetical protein